MAQHIDKDVEQPSNDDLRRAYERGMNGKTGLFEQTEEEKQKELEGKREQAKDYSSQDDED